MQLPADVSYCWLRDDPDLYDDRTAMLSSAERARMASFKAEKRRHEFVLGRAAARQLLAGRLNVAPPQVPLAVAADGGLELDGGDLHVSITHTARQAVAAVGHRPVGVDLESIRTSATDVHRYVYHPDDYGLFDRLEMEPAKAQILAWALKEAALKARRTGLRFSPRRMRLSVSLEERTALLEEDEGALWHARFLEQDGLFLAIAWAP